MTTVEDWHGALYEIEIAYVCFLRGYVVWWDDEPWDDYIFATHQDAISAIQAALRK